MGEHAACDDLPEDGEWVDCWECFGEGGHHDCGEDCCPCLHPEDDLVDCGLCDGLGVVFVRDSEVDDG